MRQLVLSRLIVEQIRAEGLAAYPNECCGLLVGRDEAVAEKSGSVKRRTILRIWPMPNTFDPAERYHRFTIDPIAQIEAEKFADANLMAVVGYYHSHPDHPARPSEYDRQHVPPWGFYSHIIVAIEKGEPTMMTAWTIDEASETFLAQEIEIV